MRFLILIAVACICIASLLASMFVSSFFLIAFILFLGLFALAIRDIFQTRHSILRNFPILGHFRYLFEMIRPEIAQYFIETDTNGTPISREYRSVVYQRAKQQRDTVPFGTKRDVYENGYEWISHSLTHQKVAPESLRITLGNQQCSQKYSASLFNISAMSYGSLSKNSVLALNKGARLGNFAHNTGEGGVSPYHLKPKGDLIWQIGTGYFGARDKYGLFCKNTFKDNVIHENIKAIELKLSQGAKPGHGGILPAVKITPELAKIRKVPMGKDVISPPTHASFDNPIGLLEFLQRLRDLSGGKPVGFKLCIGNKQEFVNICKAIQETQIIPDFISVDGAEGGTGAAPIEYTNSVGMPLVDGLIFVHQMLLGLNLKKDIQILAAGKVFTAFHIIRLLALGADACYSARGMMLALGCIQALKCNDNHCPTGVATQNETLMQGLHVESKAKRVASYHQETIESLAHLMESIGVDKSENLAPRHIYRRVASNDIKTYAQLYPSIEPASLLKAPYPQLYSDLLQNAQSKSF